MEIAASRDAFCARTGSGAVLCWPEADLAASKPALAARAERLVCHGTECCATGSGKANVCWETGRTRSKRPLPPRVALNACRLRGAAGLCGADSGVVDRLDDVRDISTGDEHACVLHGDGRVSCWGDNDRGQLGDGSRQDRRAPVAVVGVAGARELVVSGDHSCVRTADGAVRCWGDNRVGQVDGSEPSARWKARAIPELDGVAGIASGTTATCAWKDDGAVHCWGYGVPVEDERGSRCEPDPVAAPPLRGLDRIVSVSPPWKLVGSVLAPFDDSERYDRVVQAVFGRGHQCLVEKAGRVLCRGRNNRGQVDPTLKVRHQNQFAAVAGVPPSREVVLGAEGSCALALGGGLYCWGGLSSVDLIEAANPRPRPVAGAHGLTSVGIGYFGSLCSTSPHNGLACWVERDGARTSTSIDIPGAVQVVGNGDFFCALTNAGKVACFREPGQGTQVGPRAIEALDGAKALTLGRDHGCALRDDGTVACWGDGRACQLGEAAFRTTPVTALAPGAPRACPDGRPRDPTGRCPCPMHHSWSEAEFRCKQAWGRGGTKPCACRTHGGDVANACQVCLASRPRFRSCYNQAKVDHPGIRGSVTLTLRAVSYTHLTLPTIYSV